MQETWICDHFITLQLGVTCTQYKLYYNACNTQPRSYPNRCDRARGQGGEQSLTCKLKDLIDGLGQGDEVPHCRSRKRFFALGMERMKGDTLGHC